MIATIKPPQRPDFPEFNHCRGYMRERILQAQAAAASAMPDRRVVRRKDILDSTHWTVPARRVRAMLAPGRRRRELEMYWRLAEASNGVEVIDNGPGFLPTVVVLYRPSL